MAGLATQYLVIDDFLGAEAADRLLAEMIAAKQLYTPSAVRQKDGIGIDAGFRSSLRLPGRVGVELDGFKAAIHDRFDELCAATGIAPFAIYHTECSIVAHNHGDFYRTHIDTRTGKPETKDRQIRLLSCVYYLNRRPAKFTGGELALHPLGGVENAESAMKIAPVHNRLVTFPAFVPHEVLPISCPGGAFEDARFSINCWLHREFTKQA